MATSFFAFRGNHSDLTDEISNIKFVALLALTNEVFAPRLLLTLKPRSTNRFFSDMAIIKSLLDAVGDLRRGC